MSASATTDFDMMGDTLAADPYPTLRALRETAPVLWHETYKRWMVTTDRAVRKVIIDYRQFTVETSTVPDLFGADAFISIDDRRKHDDLRGAWTHAFGKQALDALAPTITGFVDDLIAPAIERLRDGEAVDLTATLCRPTPTLVIAHMMGVPRDMLPHVVRWSDAMAAGGTAYLSEDGARLLREREDAKSSLADYLLGQLAYRRRVPGPDLITAMVQSEAARGFDDMQLMQNVRQLLFAGNETTAKWLAQMFLTYAKHPATWRELRQDRSLVQQANDEVMRFDSVVGTLVRCVRGAPIDVAGVEMKEGDNITLLLSSANRDPARYENPDRFDIHRPQLPNMGFGVGFHNCLGSTLAKLEAEIATNRLLDAVPEYHIAAPYRFTTLPLRGPMPVIIAA